MGLFTVRARMSGGKCSLIAMSVAPIIAFGMSGSKFPNNAANCPQPDPKAVIAGLMFTEALLYSVPSSKRLN